MSVVVMLPLSSSVLLSASAWSAHVRRVPLVDVERIPCDPTQWNLSKEGNQEGK
jgi:hypothetical protein